MALGCGNANPSRSVGRPPTGPVVRPQPSSLRIAEVYVADADVAEHFVELAVDAEAVDTSAAELCGPVGCIDTQTCNPIGTRLVCDIGALDLPPSAGELAVVSDNVVIAYLAWGADPSVFDSPWAAAAVLSGETEPGVHVPLPFPMPFGVAMVHEADGTMGCALPSPGGDGSLDASLCNELPPSLFISEIFAPDDDEAPSWVELENSANSAIRLAGARLCQLPSCAAFGYHDTIGALSRILVHLGRSGGDTDSAQLFFADADPVRAGGEVVLLAPGGGNVAGETESLLSFLRYGTALTGSLAAAAVDAGLWPEIFDVARAPRVAGESLSRDLSGELRGSAWNPTEPTPIAANPDINAASDLWQSCSFPRPWRDAEPSDIVVARISSVVPMTITVENRGQAPIDLTMHELAIAAATRRLSDATALGTSTGVGDQSVTRISNTGVNLDDFVRAAPTPESATVAPCTGVVISEIITDPLEDWNDSTAAVVVPYDATPGTGTVDTADQWLELHNCGPAEVDLAGYTVQLTDSTPNLIELGVTLEGQVLVGSLLMPVGGTLLVGNPDPVAGLDDLLEVRLTDSTGILVDRVLLGEELGAGASTIVELRIDAGDCSDPLHVCWRGAPQLPGNGELSLFDAGTIVQHIRWGSAARVFTADAVTAGVWPLEHCALPELAEGGVIELVRLETGHSPPDYR